MSCQSHPLTTSMFDSVLPRHLNEYDMPSLQSQAEAARLHLKRAFDDARSNANRNGRKDHKGLRPTTLPMERNTAVLWGLYHGWSDDEIGRYFYINKSIVRRRRRLLDETPQRRLPNPRPPQGPCRYQAGLQV